APHALELDEAEQLTLTQRWSWGYNSQPPLYTWLQIPFFSLFGPSVFALSLLKNILLFFCYFFTFLAARQLTRNHFLALAAAVSVLFFPEIAWQSQIDRTHSILAILLASATLCVFLRIPSRRTLVNYVLLGLCAGLALIAKYNVIFFLAGLPLAALTVREYRPVILNPRILASLALMLAIFLPNGIWMLHHPDLALMTSSKFHISSGGHTINFTGLAKVALAAAVTLGPLLLVHAAVFLRKNTITPLKNLPPSFHLLWRAALLILAAICIAVLVSGTTSVRERWLQPLLGFAPVLSLLYFQNALTPHRFRQILAAGVVVMLAILLFFPARLVFADALKMPQRLNLPADTLAPQIDKSLVGIPVVITDTWLTSGNLRLNLPGERMYVSPEFTTLLAPDAPRVGIVWDATTKDAPPKLLADYLQSAGIDLSSAPPQFFSAPCRYSKTKVQRLAVVVLDKARRGWPTSAIPAQ
ncbi:MAG TPA: glycosyltransferase family 39 protein, partial [Phycisphaerae bacterium]|nr:glycosyltransferase family 39 protein [Phycisphaerae bacterium]